MKNNLLIDTARAVMERDFATLYGIEELADMLEVTAPHLIREFSKAEGMTPGKYLKKCRINYAEKLLAGSDHPVKLICVMCGYAEAGYFSRVFKEETGFSPSEYRKEFSGKRVSKAYGEATEAEKAMYL